MLTSLPLYAQVTSVLLVAVDHAGFLQNNRNRGLSEMWIMHATCNKSRSKSAIGNAKR